MTKTTVCVAALLVCAASTAVVEAHSGPPFPIVTDKIVGAYEVSIWTDPDVTDNRDPQGKFWVTLRKADRTAVPDGTRVQMTIKALDRPAEPVTGPAEPTPQNRAQYFVGLLMDHEGPFSVHVAVDGTLGRADVDSMTDATYDLRPRPILTLLFLSPFVLAGLVWGKLLLKRRQLTKRRA